MLGAQAHAQYVPMLGHATVATQRYTLTAGHAATTHASFKRIFFSHNHFEIHDDHDWRVYGNDLSETPVPKPTRWAISEFLSRRLKSNSLHYVRSLQYWFLCSVTSLTEPNGERTVDDEIFAEDVSMYQDWLQVLGNVKERLKLRLFIWDCFRLEGDLKMDTCRKMQPEQCFTLVEPLRDKIFGRPMSIEVQELVLDTEESQVELRLQYVRQSHAKERLFHLNTIAEVRHSRAARASDSGMSYADYDEELNADIIEELIITQDSQDDYT
ncbi:hypothetical protein TruAng_002051 [Truncatella angustata]|nr:hypothetical protein TruAng_002051 [Truncatella angustata]